MVVIFVSSDIWQISLLSKVIFGRFLIVVKDLTKVTIDTCQKRDTWHIFDSCHDTSKILINKSLLLTGTAREIINRVQKLRKKAHLVPTDEIKVFYDTENDLERVASEYKEFIENTIKATFEKSEKLSNSDQIIIEETQQLKNWKLHLVLTRRGETIELPVVRWANIELINLKPYYCNNSTKALILLETPNKKIDLQTLRREIASLFGLQHDFKVFARHGNVANDKMVAQVAAGDTLYVLPTDVGEFKVPQVANGRPYCKIRNFAEGLVRGTLVLENPQGVATLKEGDDAGEVIRRWVRGQ